MFALSCTFSTCVGALKSEAQLCHMFIKICAYISHHRIPFFLARTSRNDPKIGTMASRVSHVVKDAEKVWQLSICCP